MTNIEENNGIEILNDLELMTGNTIYWLLIEMNMRNLF